MPLRPIHKMRPVVQEWSQHTDRKHAVLDLMNRLLDKFEQIKAEMNMDDCEVMYHNPSEFSHLSIVLQCKCNVNSENFLVSAFNTNKIKDLWLISTVPEDRDYSHLDRLKQGVDTASKNTFRIKIKINKNDLRDHQALIDNQIRLALQHTKSLICH